jgi:hypothetical protein
MNGPVILNNAREQLADKIVGYREPKPSPLKISPWLAMSLLQKAIRRGESELAQHAAATLLLIAPDRLWRRCGAAAFEEIGVAGLQTVSLVTAALAGKRYRATIGGEWKVASFVVDRMTKAPKCRAADDLLLTADTLRRSKTDQNGAGRKIGIPHGRGRWCPVVALEQWRTASGVTEGAIFRPIDRHHRLGPKRLSAEAVCLISRG